VVSVVPVAVRVPVAATVVSVALAERRGRSHYGVRAVPVVLVVMAPVVVRVAGAELVAIRVCWPCGALVVPVVRAATAVMMATVVMVAPVVTLR
jgi:hypothetical protein